MEIWDFCRKPKRNIRGGRRGQAKRGEPSSIKIEYKGKGKVVGIEKSGKKVKPIVIPKRATSRRVKASSASGSAPSLNPAKVQQRRVLMRRATSRAKRKSGTVLELYAGRGSLTKKVYARKAKKVVMVDKDRNALRQADRKLKGRVKREIIAEDNRKYIKREMKPSQLKNLKVVDFDAYGCPADTMKAFFKKYPVKKTLHVAVTDGSARYLGYTKSTRRARSWVKRRYGVEPNKGTKLGTREAQREILLKFMKKEGRKHGFKVEEVSVAHGGSHTIYVGYKLTPVK